MLLRRRNRKGADGMAERSEERSGQARRRLGRPDGQSERADGQSERMDGQSEQAEIRSQGQRLDRLAREVDRLAAGMERAKIAEYVDLLNRPLSLIWRNLVSGMARGIGIAIGFTFFAATILYVLQLLGKLNLPIIGDYIADIVRIVQRQLEGRTY
jgi:hypothetical protein